MHDKRNPDTRSPGNFHWRAFRFGSRWVRTSLPHAPLLVPMLLPAILSACSGPTQQAPASRTGPTTQTADRAGADIAPLAVPDGSPARIQTKQEALAMDAREYAKSQHVSQAEAERRMRIQLAHGPVISSLRRRHRDRLAGLFIEHEPEYRIVLRLTGNAPVPDEVALIAGERVPVQYRIGAGATEQELLDAVQVHLPELRRRLPGMQGIYADVRTGEIAIDVHAPGDEAAGIRANQPRIEALLGHPARIDFVGPIREL